MKSECLSKLAPYLAGYIWQRDPFVLYCSDEVEASWSSEEEACEMPHLWGYTRFGDTIDDEWFIVGLLQYLTSCIHGLAARVWDNDGEFLLIECALHIPRWLKPNNSANRVWLFNGKLHIIPRQECEGSVTLQSALPTLSSKEIDSEAGEKIQEALLQRTTGYPESASRNLHWARCRVPAVIGQILRSAPQMVSEASQCFIHRSGEETKIAAHMSRFGDAATAPAMVRFHRTTYAQLMAQQFRPPKGYSMPNRQDPGYKAADLGWKLVAGFEILYHKSRLVGGDMGKCEMDLDLNPSWCDFRASLERHGYFYGRAPESSRYLELLSAAKEAFLSSAAFDGLQGLSCCASRMDAVLKDIDANEEHEQAELFAEDDDSWLSVREEDLDAELGKLGNEVKVSHGSSAQEFNPEDLADGLKAFVHNLSSYEGAEIPKEGYGDVSLDSEVFMKELQNALGFLDGGERDPEVSSEGSESLTSISDEADDQDVIERPRRHEVQTATDSDDDSNDTHQFAEVYQEAMDSELQGTKVVEKPIEATNLDEQDDAGEPINIDAQVVKNLLESYSIQNGIPGPVGNLLGMMDVRVPESHDDSNRKEGG